MACRRRSLAQSQYRPVDPRRGSRGAGLNGNLAHRSTSRARPHPRRRFRGPARARARAASEPQADAVHLRDRRSLSSTARRRGAGREQPVPRRHASVVADQRRCRDRRALPGAFALARPDLEEELSRLVGDLPAQRLVACRASGARRGRASSRAPPGRISPSICRRRAAISSSQPELEEFLRGVDRAARNGRSRRGPARAARAAARGTP